MRRELGKHSPVSEAYWNKLRDMARAIPGIESGYVYKACLFLSLRRKPLTKDAVIRQAKRLKEDYERSEDE